MPKYSIKSKVLSHQDAMNLWKDIDIALEDELIMANISREEEKRLLNLYNALEDPADYDTFELSPLAYDVAMKIQGLLK